MKYYQLGNDFYAEDEHYRFKISGPPQPLPPELSDLNEIGRNLQIATLVEMATGLLRYTTSPAQARGQFMTTLYCAKSAEARQLLELPSQNNAKYKSLVDIPAGTFVVFGETTSAFVTQVFVPDTANLIYHEPQPHG